MGAIQPASEIKLLSVDEMGYRITDKNKETGEAVCPVPSALSGWPFLAKALK